VAVDRFVTSAAGVDASAGATEATLDEAEVKRALAANAGEVILAVDSAKLDERAIAVALDWPEIDAVVTELDPHDARLARYHELARVL
jgi:DeoR/GlpR family transcriptional regulator of sugar metabolism